jgi:peptide/nickel transport system permease protein
MLRNAFIPVVTIIGIQMGALLGGTVIVEFIFNWPGLSTLLITSIQRRDYPVVQGIVLVIATLFILINLLVDLLYSWLDPRIRHRA